MVCIEHLEPDLARSCACASKHTRRHAPARRYRRRAADSVAPFSASQRTRESRKKHAPTAEASCDTQVSTCTRRSVGTGSVVRLWCAVGGIAGLALERLT